MSDPKIDGFELKPGFRGMASDTGSDQTMFKGVHWGKAMMWIFLLSDTFVFSCFLIWLYFFIKINNLTTFFTVLSEWFVEISFLLYVN